MQTLHCKGGKNQVHAFERLHRRIQEKTENPAAKPVTYVAIGDSVTQGAMELGVIEHKQVYHQLLRLRIAKRYPNCILNVINAGASGETADQSRKRWERDVLRFDPDLVTIKFGLNDAHEGEQGLDKFIRSIEDLIYQIRTKTEADLLLLTPNMMMKKENPRIAEGHRQHIPRFVQLHEQGHLARYVEALRTFAAEQSVPLLDAYAMWESMEQEGIDIHDRLANGINHPDRQFHEQLAASMEQFLFNQS